MKNIERIILITWESRLMFKTLSGVMTRYLKLSTEDEVNGDVLSNLYET